ncbi:MAG: hypothetical protein HY466_03820 [Deltaproteobacteria bacterium]|nr:hypothetical protein [Deltaproteobacteria bacterium]
MSVFTLRLDPGLAQKLDRYCKESGYKKTGFIAALIRKFFQKEEFPSPPSRKTQKRRLKGMVGIVSLGGDAVKDADAYFE